MSILLEKCCLPVEAVWTFTMFSYNSKVGKPYKDVKRSINSACRRAGISGFIFHDLRHAFASHLVMAGVDLTTVKELLGHKTIAMTMRYAHLAPSHKVKAVNILDETLKGKPKHTPDSMSTIQSGVGQG